MARVCGVFHWVFMPSPTHHAASKPADNAEPTTAFGNFSRPVLDELEQINYSMRYPDQFVLFTEGEAPRGVFILCSGRVKLFICSGDGKTLVMRMANPGDILGLPGTLSGRQYEVTAETIGPCLLAFINRDSFLRFMRAHQEVCIAVTYQLVQIYSSACDEIRRNALSHTAGEKLAKLMLEWPLANGDTPDHIKFSFTHEQLAQMIGSSRETVSRWLTEFKKKHVAELVGGTLHICDRASLQAIAEGSPLSSLWTESPADSVNGFHHDGP